MNPQRVADDDNQFEIGFEQVMLKPGLDLELHDEASGRLLECKAMFVLSHVAKGVLIAFQAGDAASLALVAGRLYRVSGFSGKFDFSFTSKALKVDLEQSTVLLAVPASVTIRFVRKHRRADLSLAANVYPAGRDKPVQVTIKNLSLGGAAISSLKPLGASGDSVTLRITIVFDNKKEDLNLVSVVRRVSESRDSLMVDSGVEFVDVSRNDKLLLHYYITTQESDFDLV